MKSTARAPKKDAAPSPRSRAKARPKARAKSKSKPVIASSIWDWKTPDEATKLRWAGVMVMLLLAVTLVASGEVRSQGGAWRAGFRDWRGQWVLGIHWRWGEWPRRWSPP